MAGSFLICVKFSYKMDYRRLLSLNKLYIEVENDLLVS